MAGKFFKAFVLGGGVEAILRLSSNGVFNLPAVTFYMPDGGMYETVLQGLMRADGLPPQTPEEWRSNALDFIEGCDETALNEILAHCQHYVNEAVTQESGPQSGEIVQ